MLNGANCTRALEPIKVIPSRNDGPYAMKTVLGWCIVGPINYRNLSEGKISCNPTAAMKAAGSKVGRHYLTMVNKVTLDDNVKSMFKKNYEQEFSIIGETAEDVALRLMDQETVQVGNHYEVPLPLKLTDFAFPNNTFAATKRLNCLKARFIRDKSFKMYKIFIGNMLQKGYARKAENEQVGNIWYIPHHGVA